METNNNCVDSLINEIQEDVKKYIKHNKSMPLSYAVTRKQKRRLNELAKEGQVPKVVYRGEEIIVSTDVMRWY